MSSLENKTAVITGSSSGIGKAIALSFAAAGARVVINYCRSQDAAQQVVNEIINSGGQALAIQADVSQQQEVDALLEQIKAQLGKVDIWVNNAGADILTANNADKTREEKLQNLLQVDLQGTIICSWAVAAHMYDTGGGTIINMSWDQAAQGYQGLNPQMFAAVKAGVTAFSKSLAKTVGPAIRVNILAPGWIQTEFADSDMDDSYHQQRCAEIPLGRFGHPDEVAAAALFLASDDSAYMTGAVLNVGGGFNLC